jgi:hypothetical protein
VLLSQTFVQCPVASLSKPISAFRLPNGDLVVTGGHHRIAAMQSLGETSIPTLIRNFDAANPAHRIFLGQMLGIGRITGKYVSDFYPVLSPEELRKVTSYLEAWKRAEGY